MSNPDGSQINWTEGLPPALISKGTDYILNKDKRYAMSISPAILVDASGREGVLLAKGSSGTQEPAVWFGDGAKPLSQQS